MEKTKNFLKAVVLCVCFVLALLFMVAVGDASNDTVQAKSHSKPENLVKVPTSEPWMQEVTENTAAIYNQLCVKDGDKYYSLAGDIPEPLYTNEMREMGFHVADRANVFVREGYETVISCDDVVIPVVSAKKGTKLVHFYSTEESVAALQRAEKLGYTIFLVDAGNGIILNDVSYPCDSFQVLDAGGKAVADYRDLEYGARYTVKWTKDGHSYRRSMVANCSVYSVDMEDNHVYSGMVGPEGYSVYDVSDLEDGLYFTHLGGLVEIVESRDTP